MKSMIYQYKMVHKVDAIMVSTEREKQTINRLGWKSVLTWFRKAF